VSDSQVDRSHVVNEICAPEVYVASPTLAPRKVILAEPVAALLLDSTTLTDTSWTDIKAETEPIRRPTLNICFHELALLCKLRHRSVVPDSQVDRSQDVRPIAPLAVNAACPMFAPCTVTLADPVAPRFALRITLKLLASNDPPWLKLPYLTPAVNVASRLPITPCPAWHRSDVSASHVVRSHAVRPRLADPVYAVRPRLDPCTVTLVDPLAAQLLRLDALAIVTSTEKPLDMLPARRPAVIDTLWLPIEESASWHRNEVSDSHVVRSHVVPPSLEIAVNVVSPKLLPWSVTLVDPLPALFLRLLTLNTSRSEENPSDRLPTRIAREAITLRLPDNPCPV